MKVAVVGAGIAGLTTAYLLAEQGHRVHIYDGSGVANKCSYANGGQISVSNSEVWNSYSNVLKGAKWAFSNDAPLALRLDHWSKEKVLWMLRFLAAIPHRDAATRKTIQYALRSREMLNQLPFSYSKKQNGIMHIYKNQKSLDAAMKSMEKYPEMGRKAVSVKKMKKIEPALNYESILGGSYTKDDFTGDIHQFCTAIHRYMLRNLDVCYTRTRVVPEDLDADIVMLCRGAESGGRVYPIKGYSITCRATAAPTVSILDDEAKIVTSNFGDRFRVAGTAELAGWDESIRLERVQPLINWVHTNTNEITQDLTMWSCLRPMNPNMLPTVERNGRYISNTGAGHLGWTMCMALAEEAVSLV